MQIIVYTSAFNVFINQVSKIMNKSNAKSLWIIQSCYINKQYHQCMICAWTKGHLSAKSQKVVAIFYLYGGQITYFMFPCTPWKKKNIAILLGLRLSFLESHVLPCINLYTRSYNVFKTQIFLFSRTLQGQGQIH